jgi:hypothetical protein
MFTLDLTRQFEINDAEGEHDTWADSLNARLELLQDRKPAEVSLCEEPIQGPSDSRWTRSHKL